MTRAVRRAHSFAKGANERGTRLNSLRKKSFRSESGTLSG